MEDDQYTLQAALALSNGNKAKTVREHGIIFVVEQHWTPEQDFYSVSIIEHNHASRERALNNEQFVQLQREYDLPDFIWSPV